MDTTQLPPDFKEFLKLLTEHKVEYLLIGGYAVGYFGTSVPPRTSMSGSLLMRPMQTDWYPR